MRFAVILVLLPLPAAAWDFSPDPVCTLTRQTETGEIVITYDAALPEYALTITLAGSVWPDAGSFTMEFLGPRPATIGTTRQTKSRDNSALTVRDTGFGNVLDGLEFNSVVQARSGDQTVTASLRGAAPAVQAFRTCPNPIPATS